VLVKFFSREKTEIDDFRIINFKLSYYYKIKMLNDKLIRLIIMLQRQSLFTFSRINNNL